MNETCTDFNMSGVTKLDRMRNGRIYGIAKVGEISKKVQQSRLKLYAWVCIEKRRTTCGQDSDGDGGVGKKKKKRKTEVVVVG